MNSPNHLHHREKAAEDGLLYLGWVVAHRARPLERLLERYAIQMPIQPTDQVLTQALLLALAEKGKAFRRDLSMLAGNDSFYDHFSGDSPSMPGVTVGADPVSAIAGAVGSIANVVGFAQQKKNLEKQGRQASLKALLNHRSQVMQPTTAVPAQTDTAKMVIAGFGILLLGVLATYLNKQGKLPALG